MGEEAMSFTPWSASDKLRRSLEFYTLAAAEFTRAPDFGGKISLGAVYELAAAWGHSILLISIATARGRHICRLEQLRAHVN